MSYTLEKLVDFSSQIYCGNHQYFDNSGEFTDQKRVRKGDQAVNNLTNYIFNLHGEIENEDVDTRNQNKIVFNECLENIKTHLHNKVSGFRRLFISRFEIARIEGVIAMIQTQRFDPVLLVPTEQGFRVKAYRDLSNRLKIKNVAGTNESKAIKKVSEALFAKYSNDYNRYRKEMKHFFKGAHMLFDETLKDDLEKCGALIRTSSHYDFGAIDHVKGGVAPIDEAHALGFGVIAQYKITGPQVKEMLFGKVTLETDGNHRPIFGRKAPENALFTKTYTFIQTEWAPDSRDWKTGDWWKHRVLSFGLYASRKLLGFAKPNVGPYGYGRADNNPIVV